MRIASRAPPNPTQLSQLKNRGAKVMVYRGVADPIFSVDDTKAWYDGLRANRTRPLCPYPQVARYNGTGDLELAASFSCQ